MQYAWDTLDDIENMALLLAQNVPRRTRKKAMRKFLPAYEELGGLKQIIIFNQALLWIRVLKWCNSKAKVGKGVIGLAP